MIKLLIVDDSSLMRKVLGDTVSLDDEIEVVGYGKNGLECLQLAEELKPDVITLDIEMPKMDGLGVLREFQIKNINIPVIMISSLTTEGATHTLEALELGAFDFFPKPTNFFSLSQESQRKEIIEKIRTAVKSKKTLFSTSKLKKNSITFQKPLNKANIETDIKREKLNSNFKNLILIGSSTGGPKALQAILPKFSKDLDAAIVIVQHMPAKFTKSLAERLDVLSSIGVKEAENGECLYKGQAYIAPGDFHLKIREREGKLFVDLDQDDKWLGLRPTVDKLFESSISVKNYNKVAVILTGMGSDGSKFLDQMKKTTKIIAQDEASSIVFGMPKSAIETNCVDQVVSLDSICENISNFLEV